ncbi:TolB family protein [Actinomadura macrotermitis]|uniref:TolB n=1 Tax=Actinomadura macrotermitis TaxID=2585200 RepID=A0A7K0C399_9ACTN|nr:hypothetical protein [Actinomadura macrotermitis]MQY07910.1 hypothetical protein [Actinomadura macrotermitis]
MNEGRRRTVVVVAAAGLLAATGATYSAMAARRDDPGPRAATLDLGRGGQLMYRAGSGRVASAPLAAPASAPALGARSCARFYAANGTGACLATQAGPVPGTSMTVLDRSMREVGKVKLAGVPNRARVSPSGRMVSWTVFVRGDAYNETGFSTWTGILDTRTGYTVVNMEQIPLFKDGRRYRSPDVNYWGVTFAADDNRFYASMSSKGRTYLVQGDYGAWEAKVLRENLECPSLSPDGRRLAFKKRVSADPARPWRLYVLDLATMRETALAETASVDDQAAWLDDRTVMYALPRQGGGSDVWSVPADGSGTPSRLVPGASSPVAVR